MGASGGNRGAHGIHDGSTDRAGLMALRKENAQLKRTNNVLRTPSAFSRRNATRPNRGDGAPRRVSAAARRVRPLGTSAVYRSPVSLYFLATWDGSLRASVPVSSCPACGSLNLVERWFAELTTKRIRHDAHRSVQALEKDAHTWIATVGGDGVA